MSKDDKERRPSRIHSNPAGTERRKKAHREANEARHKANLAEVRELGLLDRLTTVTRMHGQRRDKEIILVPRVVTKKVRPSKLLRTERRAEARGGL